MAHLTISSGVIDEVVQTVVIDGGVNNNAWCSSVSCSAGLGAATATIDLPFMTADEAGKRFADKKVIVRAGIGQASRVAFIGFISGKNEDISENSDSVSLTAYTVGHYLSGIGVGEENNLWNYKYPLFSDLTGTPSGWTPAGVLLDLFARLPERWTDEIALGNITALADSYDLPVQNYEFSLASYQSAIDSIVTSMGDVMVVERFSSDKVLLDFIRISDPNAPKSSVRVDDYGDRTDANVGKYTPNITTDEMRNRAVAYGRDKEFMITCKSTVTGLDAQSEANPAKALLKSWDVELEAMVKTDPKLASNDRINRSLTIKGTTAPGTGGTTFDCEVGVDLIANKCILVHPKSGERMLVTGYTPKVPAQPLEEPPVEEVKATVTVQRLFQAEAGQNIGDLKLADKLTVEVPGISNVFRRYRLPVALLSYPKREFLSDIPVIDEETLERHDAQVFCYKSNLSAHEADTKKKLGSIAVKPSLLQDCKKDFDKHRIHLKEPALAAVAVEKTTDGKVKTTYTETVVGVTFAYIDPFHPYGWNTGVVKSELKLPWQMQTERLKLEELLYQQATNEGFPIVDALGVQLEFSAQFIDPLADTVVTGMAVLRNDQAYLRTAAERVLAEKNRPHVSGNIEVLWLDLGYRIGNQLDVLGLSNQPDELLTITQVSWTMGAEGGQSTSMTVDNIKPPARQRFNTKFQKAM